MKNDKVSIISAINGWIISQVGNIANTNKEGEDLLAYNHFHNKPVDN